LVTDSSLVPGAFADFLAGRAAFDQEARRKLRVRAVAIVLVAILHVLMIAALLVAQVLPNPHRGPRAATEIELILAPLMKPATTPKVIETKPSRRLIEEIEPRPITVQPPPIETTKTPTDVMRALGAELACGASHYEYLNEAERKLCKKAPWKLPDNRAVAIAPPPPPAFHLTGAEAAQQKAREAPPCAPGMIVCPDEVIHGKSY
jgi:hypothetical protein